MDKVDFAFLIRFLKEESIYDQEIRRTIKTCCYKKITIPKMARYITYSQYRYTYSLKFADKYIFFKYNKTKKELFDEFLVNNDIYNIFYKNIKNKRISTCHLQQCKNLDDFFNKTFIENLIVDSFTWVKNSSFKI